MHFSAVGWAQKSALPSCTTADWAGVARMYLCQRCVRVDIRVVGEVGAGRGGSASVCVVLGPQGVSVPGQPALPLALQPVKGLGFVTEATVAPSRLASR